MITLKAENRNTSLKPNQLRRNKIIPGVLYGKSLEASLSIQFSQSDVTRFLRTNSTGSKAELVIGDKKFPSLLREIGYKPTTGDAEHLSFQALTADEVITSTMRVILVNREKVQGIVHQPQSEISYKALATHLVDKVEIDMEGMTEGTVVKLSDLDIVKNPNIEILTPLDATVLSVVEAQKAVEASDEGAEAEGTESE